MSLIKFTDCSGNGDLYIESSKIGGLAKTADNQTLVFMAAGETFEEWIVGEPIDQVVMKVPLL